MFTNRIVSDMGNDNAFIRASIFSPNSHDKDLRKGEISKKFITWKSLKQDIEWGSKIVDWKEPQNKSMSLIPILQHYL